VCSSDLVYVLVSKMTTGGSGGGMCGGTGGSTGSGTGTRDLVAYGLDGHVLWTFPVVR
jgi:hypothetical protein